MSDREELATTILAYFHPSPYAGESWRLDPTSAADAILAAGYRKPRTIESDDQLREMKAIGTLLRDGKGRVVERVETLPGHLRWYWLSNNIVNSVWPVLPATVLWEPLP